MSRHAVSGQTEQGSANCRRSAPRPHRSGAVNEQGEVRCHSRRRSSMNCWAASRSHRRRARYIGRFPRPLDSMNVTAVLVIRPTRHFALARRDRTGEPDMKATARIAAGKKRLEVIMSRFTIETTYRLPVYRQRTYEAETLDQACRLAIEDDDWSEQKEDYDCSGDTYVTGPWPREDTAHSVTALT